MRHKKPIKTRTVVILEDVFNSFAHDYFYRHPELQDADVPVEEILEELMLSYADEEAYERAADVKFVLEHISETKWKNGDLRCTVVLE